MPLSCGEQGALYSDNTNCDPEVEANDDFCSFVFYYQQNPTQTFFLCYHSRVSSVADEINGTTSARYRYATFAGPCNTLIEFIQIHPHTHYSNGLNVCTRYIIVALVLYTRDFLVRHATSTNKYIRVSVVKSHNSALIAVCIHTEWPANGHTAYHSQPAMCFHDTKTCIILVHVHTERQRSANPLNETHSLHGKIGVFEK